MPGPHFNSKRLKAAKNVRAEFAPGSVPRVGTRLFTLRLLPRTVEKNCGCTVRLPYVPPAAVIPTITITTAFFANSTHIQDPTNYWGNGPTPTFWDTAQTQVGDAIVFIHPTTAVETTVNVAGMDTHANGKIFKIHTTPPHGVVSGTTNVTMTIPDRS